MAEKSISKVLFFLKSRLEADGVNVKQIAIFGSFMRGSADAESDMDIIIISDDFQGKNIFQRSRMTSLAQRAAIRKFMLPLDVLKMTTAEYQDLLESKRFKTKIVA